MPEGAGGRFAFRAMLQKEGLDKGVAAEDTEKFGATIAAKAYDAYGAP